MSNCVPLSGVCNFTRMDLEDGPPADASAPQGVGVRWATPGYFRVMRVPLLGGRLFISADRVGAAKVVLVTETTAKRFWPAGDAIGRRVTVYQGGFADGAEVVGIVGDVRTVADSTPKPDVYLPYAQSPQSEVILFLRAARDGDIASLAAAARRVIHDLAPGFPVYDVQTMSARVAATTAQPRFSAALLALFAAVAMTLAVVGIYGVMSYLVGQRMREMGIRMALGAGAGHLMRMVVGEGLRLAAAGAALGLGGALLFTRVLRAMLFDVAPTDPATYVAIVTLLCTAVVVASYLPARRATHVDPASALRAE